MRGLRKRFVIYEHFLPWLQRSHIAPSANPFGFSFGFHDGRGGVDETLFIGMTGETFVRFRLDLGNCLRFDGHFRLCGGRCGGRLPGPTSREEENSNDQGAQEFQFHVSPLFV